MGIITWIIVGAIAGWAANLYLKTNNKQTITKVLEGMAGAVIGGFLARFVGIYTSDGLTLGNLFVAFVGSLVFIWLMKKLRNR